MPSPVRKRQTVSIATVVAKTVASEARPNNRSARINKGLRPQRSPIGPADKAPARMPMLDHKNAPVKAGPGRCQRWVSCGTDTPIELTSQASSIWINVQIATTRICRPPICWFSSAASVVDTVDCAILRLSLILPPRRYRAVLSMEFLGCGYRVAAASNPTGRRRGGVIRRNRPPSAKRQQRRRQRRHGGEKAGAEKHMPRLEAARQQKAAQRCGGNPTQAADAERPADPVCPHARRVERAGGGVGAGLAAGCRRTREKNHREQQRIGHCDQRDQGDEHDPGGKMQRQRALGAEAVDQEAEDRKSVV